MSDLSEVSESREIDSENNESVPISSNAESEIETAVLNENNNVNGSHENILAIENISEESQIKQNKRNNQSKKEKKSVLSNNQSSEYLIKSILLIDCYLLILF